jgi:hypothetical protein
VVNMDVGRPPARVDAVGVVRLGELLSFGVFVPRRCDVEVRDLSPGLSSFGSK